MNDFLQNFINSINFFTSLEIVQFLGVLAVVCAVLSLLYAVVWR